MPALVYEKMGITPEQRVLVINGPPEAVSAIELPATPSVDVRTAAVYDHIILFITSKQALDKEFPRYKALLTLTGKLWIAWPKRQLLGTDLNIKEVIRIGYTHGLVESTNLRIDDTWTALKFTHPKPGKQYNNSYGILT